MKTFTFFENIFIFFYDIIKLQKVATFEKGVIPIIYTCTLNPAIDLFVETNELEPFIVNRTNMEDYQANGKTINISLILKKMGIENTALGFIGGFTGRYIDEELQKQGIRTDFIKIDGITRINTFVRAGEKEYKIVNKGPTIKQDKQQQLINKLDSIPSGSILFISGSLPNGISDDIYLEIAKIAKENELKLIFDISSRKLLDCLPYSPYLIKPNKEELGHLFSKEVLLEEDVLHYAKTLLKMGAQNVLVSLGEDGAIFLSSERCIRVTSPKGVVVNTACAGDAFLGSFVGKKLLGASLEEALTYASATGASTAFSMGLSNLEDVEELCKEVKLDDLDLIIK